MELKWLQEDKCAAKHVEYNRLPQHRPGCAMDPYTTDTEAPSVLQSKQSPTSRASLPVRWADRHWPGKESWLGRSAGRRGELARRNTRPSKCVERRTTGQTRGRAEEDALQYRHVSNI